MNEIEERAEELYKGNTIEMDAYKEGRYEQKAVDNEKAKEAFNKACGWLAVYPWYNGVFEEFVKSLEE